MATNDPQAPNTDDLPDPHEPGIDAAERERRQAAVDQANERPAKR